MWLFVLVGFVSSFFVMFWRLFSSCFEVVIFVFVELCALRFLFYVFPLCYLFPACVYLFYFSVFFFPVFLVFSFGGVILVSVLLIFLLLIAIVLFSVCSLLSLLFLSLSFSRLLYSLCLFSSLSSLFFSILSSFS